MTRLDRYVLRQLVSLFGFFALVLVSVYWVNRAVRLFDQLISDGQSALVFLEFSALSLPPMIRIVLPLAAFIAAVYGTNRLSNESELTVMQAGGMSPFRMARPVVAFGFIVAAMVAVLTNFLEPLSSRQLDLRRNEVRADTAAQFLVEGAFVNPAKGVTLYIREITDEGELLDVFLNDSRTKGVATTYTSKRATLVDTDTGPKLVMFDGLAQRLEAETNQLSVTRFSESSYDLGALIAGPRGLRASPEHLSTLALLRADSEAQEATGKSRAVLLTEGHSRIAQPLLAVAGALLGFAPLLTGVFSRFGLWRQISVGVAGIVLVQFLANYATSIASDSDSAWPVLYVPPAAGVVFAVVLLILASRGRRVRPAKPAADAVPA